MTPAAEKVLVVDDEPDVEALVTRRFRREIRKGELEFAFARDGLDALSVIDAQPGIGVVLCDINMPRMDGLTFLDRVRGLDRSLAVVMVSAYGDMKNIRAAMNLGAFDFVTKPIEFDDLSTTLAKSRKHIRILRDSRDHEARLAEMEAELEIAQRIQRSILPTSFPDDGRFSIHGRMEPLRAVGGDFFDVIPIDEGRWLLSIADVSGKGVPGAIYMAVVQTMIRTLALVDPDPAVCVAKTNDLLCANLDSGMLTSLLLGEYDPATGRFRYTNAGHPPPLLVRAGGAVETLGDAHGVILGVQVGTPYQSATVTLAPGEAVVCYTDGVTEARDAGGEQFDEHRIREALSMPGADEAAKITARVVDAVDAYLGDVERGDDTTCLALHRTA